MESVGPKAGGPPLWALALAQKMEDNRQAYQQEDENVVCGRFPHLDICACEYNCQETIGDISLYEVYNGIFMGPFQAGFKTGELIQAGVTHILNVTCKAYTKRDKYFKYLDLQIYDEVGEDAKKYFRVTNRFINEALQSGGKILVHSIDGKSRCSTFILAYLICNEGIKLKDGLAMLRQYVAETEPNEGFMQQLAQYDLELLNVNHE
jgi:protein-tyrosine phosphatase